ncbi:grasp-with-spasm system SPASM domain peptide maturase [Flavobacterium supellecticarium]|uniref:Grasp-with-spasm system SPASM domain peptide maturase n=1 Tax=Flavobacterium supellecticarium TaxID=2565924 RepID=A0A4S4A0G2_9FLAO|nr:grasp-with-spasm system SPASM domain peptide maturase [Flavobacterium supellecticarium]THF51796.1 grasp-with-spasm system SPASM domain peptide maturase [Flavobacterium supellecticarium]
MKPQLFKLFSNCQIVIGKNRSTICDLQRNKYILIPNSLANLFDKNGIIDVSEISKKLDATNHLIFEEYLELLHKNEVIFPCTKSEIARFPVMDLEFDYPAIVSNMIIDFSKNSDHDFGLLLTKFIKPLNCRHIQVRFFDATSFNRINEIVQKVNNSFMRTIDFVIKRDFEISSTFLHWVSENKKIRSITIHSCDKTKIISEGKDGFGVVICTKQKIDSSIHCGIISPNLFNITIETFSESQNYNTCLNRKLAIASNGTIKNCPSMKEAFGNSKTTKLEEIIGNKEFKKYWNITKDQIEVCKDCEFRHICTDCRAYVENPQNRYSKPLKCGYNPYTATWEEWSHNPLKKNAIAFYEMSSEWHQNQRF